MGGQKTRDSSRALYALGTFSDAVLSLAVGPGDVRSRLLGAWSGFHTVRPEDLHGSLSRGFRWIERMLTRSEERGRIATKIVNQLAAVPLRLAAARCRGRWVVQIGDARCS